MGKRDSGQESQPGDYTGKHRAGDPSSHLRHEDVNAEGRIIGWSVGREGKPDDYTER